MPKATAGGTVVLLHGEERFLVEEKARALIADWQKELVFDFGFEPMEAAGRAVCDAIRLVLDG